MTTPRSTPRSSARRTVLGLALAAGLAFVGACSMFMRMPAEQEFGRERTSTTGLYRAVIRPDGDSIPVGKLQRWTLHLETAEGAPLDSATVSVDGGMPQHGHGLPTKPAVTASLGNGDHRVDGMKFNMSGWWVVKFRVQSAMGADSVVFNLKL
ncbi:MAG: FixH family protein [Gemmatimonadales bacterium]|nr:FixH family protein [Gemmatimonadales bacterium]